MELVQKREFTDEQRDKLAAAGHAMPDGSFPIENITDLHNAIQSVGRSKNYAAAKKHIIQRAKDLQATNILPEDWKINKFIDDVKDAFEKAIGTSSSVDQERDERSVENYVRQSANTNVIAPQPNDYTIGGNTMSNNTTEPDPKGNIAVQKDFPTAAGGPLIGNETNPNGNTSVSAAPEGPTPTEATFDSSATSAPAPSRSDELAQPTKITKSTSCPDCGANMVHECWGDSSDVNKAAGADEVTEENDNDQPVEKAAEAPVAPEPELKKSVWGGAFAPRK